MALKNGIYDIKDRKLIIAGKGKLGATFKEKLEGEFEGILIGGHEGNFDDYYSYKIGTLGNTGFSKMSNTAIGIIACTGDGIELALRDFNQKCIPIIIASTGYNENILERYSDIPLLLAPNLALPVVYIMSVFNKFPDFSDIQMKIHESHQSGKKDASGTARVIIEKFKDKGGICDAQLCQPYNPNEGVSDFGGLLSYRGKASEGRGVGEKHMSGHGYHTYEISGSGENYEQFKKEIHRWSEKYANHKFTGLSIEFIDSEDSFSFSHNINGRDIYADGLLELLPWFIQQKIGIHSVVDYLSSLK